MSDYDVIVVGVGAMGAAACYHLASRGARVLGLERFDIPHGLGSSHGFSRMIRLAYYEHAGYVPLLKSAYSLWHQLEAEGGRKLIYVTGGLYMGPSDGGLIAGSRRSSQVHGLAHEMMSREDLRRRFGQFRVPEDFVGLLERDAGFIKPEEAVATHAHLAMRRGAVLRGREPLRQWAADGAGVRATTDRGVYRAAKIIFCGGAWTDQLLGDLGISLRVTRQAQAWVWPRRPQMFELGRLPVWAIDHLDGTIHYGFPMMSDSPGFKLAHHGPAETVDPDQVSRQATESDEETIRPLLRQTIPDADGPLLSMRVCLYTNSPDGHFIVDRHPGDGRVLLAGGFSGHGFKFAPVIGQALAELALTGSASRRIEFLGLSRLKK